MLLWPHLTIDPSVCITHSQVSDAIPIPGFLDTLQPTVQAARAANNSTTTTTSSSGSSSSVTSSTEEVGAATAVSSQQQLLAAAAASLPLAEQQAMLLAGAAPALEQLSSVVNEVRRVVSLLVGCKRLVSWSHVTACSTCLGRAVTVAGLFQPRSCSRCCGCLGPFIVTLI